MVRLWLQDCAMKIMAEGGPLRFYAAWPHGGLGFRVAIDPES